MRRIYTYYDGVKCPVAEFTEDETKYAFTELLTQDNSQEDIREHTSTYFT